MTKSRFLIGLVTPAILLLSLAEGGVEAQAGTLCRKEGQVRKINGIEYVCSSSTSASKKSKSKKVLMWTRLSSTQNSGKSSGSEMLGAGVALGQWKLHRRSSDEAKSQACEQAGSLATLSNGTRVVCVDKYGDKRWAVAPDAVSIQSHQKIVSWLERVLPGLPRGASPLQMKVEPTFRESDAALIKTIVEGTRGFYVGYQADFAFVLSTTASHFYNSAREFLGARYDRASVADRDQWEFKWRQSKMENLIGGGHLGISPDLSVIALKTNFVNSALAPAEPQRRVVEDFVREYLMEVPRLEIRNHIDGSAYKRQCWLLESTAWSLTLAVMEYFKVPNFTFSESWAHWVSELADYDGTYKFGLEASEKSESVENGNPRYDMPCQLAPGVGHIQGMLARELLLSKSSMEKFEEFVASDQSRQSFSRIFGFSYDSWIAESDSRTRGLLQRYDKAPDPVDIKSLSKQPRNETEARALEDVAILLADLNSTAPAGGYASAHEFFLAFTAARDRTQAGARKVYEIVRDPLGLSASLLRAADGRACVLVVYDPQTRIATAYPAGLYTSKVESYATIPPSRRCD